MGTYSQLLFHIVFSTKDREPSITPEIQERLYEFIGGIIRDKDGVSDTIAVLSWCLTP